MAKPITPQEVNAAKERNIPPEVIECFNEAISKHWDGYRAFFYQSYIVVSIKVRLNVSGEYIFRNGYLDVEDLYRDAGWEVTYDKPAYDESYEAHFIFRKMGI